MSVLAQRRTPQERRRVVEPVRTELPPSKDKVDLIMDDPLIGNDQVLLDRLTRIQLANEARLDALRKSHDFVARVELLKRAWAEQRTGEYTRDRGLIHSKERQVSIPDYGATWEDQLEKVGRSVEQSLQAAWVLFSYRLMEMNHQIGMQDIRRYMEEVVLHGQDIPNDTREGVLYAEIVKMFAVSEDYERDVQLKEEMGDSFEFEDQYTFTFRLAEISNPLVVERLRGIVMMAIERDLVASRARLVEKHGEHSPTFQALEAYHRSLGSPGF